jgi:hypothetical protein
MLFSDRLTQRTPAGFPSGMPGIGEEIDIAMQHAPHPGLHSKTSPPKNGLYRAPHPYPYSCKDGQAVLNRTVQGNSRTSLFLPVCIGTQTGTTAGTPQLIPAERHTATACPSLLLGLKPCLSAFLFHLTKVVNNVEVVYMMCVMLEFDNCYTGKRVTLPAMQKTLCSAHSLIRQTPHP